MDIVNPRIQNYAEKYTSGESDTLRELRRKTFGEREDKNMLSGFYQGRLLSMLSKILHPRRVLEIGTYMGYSALCLAEGLTAEGKVITIDIDEETSAIARGFWGRTEFVDKIEPILGEASDIIPGLDESFDLVFIDADKSNYSKYYDLVFPKLRIGGLIVADNVLWSGDVLRADKEADVQRSTQALHEYNQKIGRDKRVSNILLAVRDGLMISRKERE